MEGLRLLQFAPRANEGDRTTDTKGSGYSGRFPASVLSPAKIDHVVPQSSLAMASQVYLNGHPREDICQTVFALRGENSSKSNRSVYLGEADDDMPDSVAKHTYHPPAIDMPFFTTARKAVVARAIAYTHLCYVLVSDASVVGGWRGAPTGNTYYARLVVEGRNTTLLDLPTEPVRDLEVTKQLLIYYMTGWLDPLSFDTSMLRDSEFRVLLKSRLKGETRISEALNTALGALVANLV